jgi:TP901 family phage tail tape measure protein
MSFQLQYTYNLINKISPSLRKIAKDVEKTQRKIKVSTRKIDRSFTGIAKSAKNLALKGIEPLKSKIAGLVATIGSLVGITKAFEILANFEEQMAKVKAVTKASSAEMANLTKLAKKLGTTTEFSASQAAEGMSFLGLAGFKTNKILESMPAVIDLATAGQLGLADAADISSNILSGFNLNAKEMARVVDVMAEVNANANTNIMQLGEAMKFVAPVAEVSNISIEKTAAAIGVLSDAGLQASMAGTGFRRIISELANPSREAQKILGALGLTQRDVDISSQGVVKVLKKLAPLAKHTGAAFKVFGDRGAPAFAVLSKNLPKLEELIKKLKDSQGAGKRLADTMRDQLGGDFKAFKSALEGLVLSIGDAGFTGALRSALQTMATFFRALSGEAESFNKMSLAARGFVNALRLIGKVIKVVFTLVGVAFAGISDVLERFLALAGRIFDYVQSLANFLTGGLFGKAIDALGRMAGLVGSGDINVNQKITSEKTNKRNDVNVNGNVGIELSGLPKGSRVAVNPDKENNINMGLNSLFRE